MSRCPLFTTGRGVRINLHGVSRDGAGVSRPREQHQSRDWAAEPGANVRDGSMLERRNLTHYELSRVWQKQELIPKLPQFIVECIRWSPLAHQKNPISSSVFSLQPLPSWIWCPGANQWAFWEQKVNSYANNILKGSNRTIVFILPR